MKKVSKSDEESTAEVITETTEEGGEKDGEKPEAESKVVEKNVDLEAQVAREDIKNVLDKYGKINVCHYTPLCVF